MRQSRVIMVSNRLPITITRAGANLQMYRSAGGLPTALNAVATKYHMRWIGWAGIDSKLTASQRAKLGVPDKLIDVPIAGYDFERYYGQLSNGVLWPVLHGLQPMQADDQAAWAAVEKVIEQFAATIQATLQPDDMIWIHDFHLVLLPEALRRHGVTNHIGFFLHTPFPPLGVFVTWPPHERILQGMCAADVIGFQTPHDEANFRQVLDTSGLPKRPGQIIGTFPVGIDYTAYQAAIPAADIKRQVAATIGAQRTVVLSVSRLDYTKGIIEQVQAFTQAAIAYQLDNVFYHSIVAPSRETLREYQDLKRSIDTTVVAANAALQSARRAAHIDFAYRNHGFDELHAWYCAADVLLITPKIDGMNLVVKEYIAARGPTPGAVVLSAKTGAAAQLTDALLVDPADITGIAQSLKQALDFSTDERVARWQGLHANVKDENVFWWAERFVDALHGTTVIAKQ